MMCVCGILGVQNFYPRPPRGGRRSRPLKHTGNVVFLSTPSARRATGGGAPQALPLLLLGSLSERQPPALLVE